MVAKIEKIALHETARTRYLNYAMSVITSRALPDVRDGLKPVQRRILYSMFSNLRLTHDAKHMKSARIVGEVMGKYHPHGDQSIYDAMVRMAQDFSVRYPLVDGHGNFGSVDGDSAAAMRYTEARLTNLSAELLDEIKKNTVGFRPNYDGTESEPAVLPAQVPNLLINGATGIAVGMATNIPPHNLGECLDALIALIDKPELQVDELVDQYIKGPDFPTGGVMLNSVEELREIYTTGSGAIQMRADWEVEPRDGKKYIVITSLPYTVNKSTLVEKIADHIIQGNLPQVLDVRDESTDDIRVVLELKRGTSPELAMAYLLKHTPLENRFHVNMTCLVPQGSSDPLADDPHLKSALKRFSTRPPEKRKADAVSVIELLGQLKDFQEAAEAAEQPVPTPSVLDLKQMLTYFRDFRMEVLVRRLLFELRKVLGRIHILEAFELIFNDLDTAIALIRQSSSKADAAARLMDYFKIDDLQADAILETKLYRLARLEIDNIRQELAECRKEATRLRGLLVSEKKRWEYIRQEFEELRKVYGDPRRTRIEADAVELEYSEAAYIIDEDAWVMVSRDGWFKRQKSYGDLSTIRVRDNDSIGWVMPGRTRSTLLIFTTAGRVYTMRIIDVPATTGYGDPLQAYFDFDDGEKVAGVLTIDPRVLSPVLPDQPSLVTEAEQGDSEMIAISAKGLGVRFSIDGFSEPSTVKGRMFMRLGKGDSVVNVEPCTCVDEELVAIATREGRGLMFKSREISQYKGAAKGVKTVALEKGDEVLGWTLSTAYYEGLEVETSRGKLFTVSRSKSAFAPTSRGNKGRHIIRRGHLVRANLPPVEIQKGEDDPGSDED